MAHNPIESGGAKRRHGGQIGHVISQAVRDKISAANRGRKIVGHPAWNKGKTLPVEYRAKLSAAHRGKSLSAEHRAKIGESNRHKKP
jgi:Ni/Co efflux regulator RcnB